MNLGLRWKIIRFFLTVIYLLGGWILFTGSFAPVSLGQGFFFSCLVAVFSYQLFIDESEVSRRSILPRIHLFLLYLIVLLAKMYLASFKVAFNVLTGNIQPRIVHFRTHLRSDMARVTLANSITLTPGTLTLDLSHDHLVVHWLDAPTSHSGYASRLIARPFERWLERIWS